MEAGRVEQLIEDLWLTEYADLCTVIDHDPHTALGYIFAFRREEEEGDDCWEAEDWSE